MAAPGNVRRAASSKTDWETPPALFDLLDSEFRFTLDAAANDANHKCTRYLTEEEDALEADVFDEVVFCNPPYGTGLDEWVRAFGRWALNGCHVVALLPANTDTRWFADVFRNADEIRFLHKRVQFVGGGNSNTGGSVIAVYRPRPLMRDRIHSGPAVGLWDWRA